MSDFLLGFQGLVQYKVGGVGSGNDWVDLTNIKDLSVKQEATKADATTRAQGGFKAEVPGLQTVGADWEMVWKPGDSGFDAIKSSFQDRAALGLRIISEVGGDGVEGDFAVFMFEKEENLDDVQKVKVSVGLTYSTTAPVWITGGG
jgi:hypothetical protein